MLQLAAAQSIRELRRSIDAGRPMSLPNLMRLCRRRLPPEASADGADAAAWMLQHLDRLYRHHQPFEQGARRIVWKGAAE